MKNAVVEDDIVEPVGHLVRERFPWLILWLIGGIITSVIISHFEKILAADIRLTFFIPVITYMSDAVGTQTETIYIRHLRQRKTDFWKYFLKETALWLSLWIMFGVIIGIFALYWLHSSNIWWTIGLAMFIDVALSPILALIFPILLYRDHLDPALGSGPLATVTQDFISLMVYFGIASLIILW